jgi:BMFP domain-containing protein YqiC
MLPGKTPTVKCQGTSAAFVPGLFGACRVVVARLTRVERELPHLFCALQSICTAVVQNPVGSNPWLGARTQSPAAHRAGEIGHNAQRQIFRSTAMNDSFRQRNTAFFDQLGRLIEKTPLHDAQRNLRALAQSAAGRLDLVTREEFEATQRMLLAARQQIDTLEAQVRELQARLDAAAPDAAASPEDAWR